MNLFQKICGTTTDHKWRKLEGYTENDPNKDEPIEYYYRCKICKYFFWNYDVPDKVNN